MSEDPGEYTVEPKAVPRASKPEIWVLQVRVVGNRRDVKKLIQKISAAAEDEFEAQTSKDGRSLSLDCNLLKWEPI